MLEMLFGTKSKPVIEPKVTVVDIHESFYSEVDKLVSYAKNLNSVETDKQALIDKCERLKKLGFKNTKEVIEAKNELDRLYRIKQENIEKDALLKAINYFSFKYPQYKFITEEGVLKLCRKYNLIYSDISRYIGTVPDKNLEHIEKFSVKEEDLAYYTAKYYFSELIKSYTIDYKRYEMEKKREIQFKESNGKAHYIRDSRISEVFEKAPLEIVAPKKDFNIEGMELKDFKLTEMVVEDPIVLQPVMYGGKKYYLIVTAWGEEASDSLVVNHLNN
jgi:hypothetical protein